MRPIEAIYGYVWSMYGYVWSIMCGLCMVYVLSMYGIFTVVYIWVYVWSNRALPPLTRPRRVTTREKDKQQ